MDLNEFNALKAQNANSLSTANGTNASSLQQSPPPVPSRVDRTPNSIYSGYGNQQYGSSYSPFNNGFAGFGSAGGYYGTGVGPTGFGYGSAAGMHYGGPAAGNSFLRAAEDSSRTAFQSIESVVHAFTAVSAMFESTYYAVYNSFRAVVGVADQFYRLKTHLTKIVSALAIMRFLKYLARKLLRLLRMNSDGRWLSGADASSSDAWSMAVDGTEKYIYANSKRQTNWPLIMFFAVVFGGPWLIWRILSSIESINKDDSLWMSGKIDHFVAVAEHDFDAENNDELSFKRGQRITLAPKEYQPKLRGWLLGTLDGQTQGIIPANYVKIMGKKMGQNSSNQQASSETNKMFEQSFC